MEHFKKMNESKLSLIWNSWRAKRKGKNVIAEQQQLRFQQIVAYARTYSPYYKELYKHLPAEIHDVDTLPVTDKRKLMAAFNEWCTDPSLTLEKIQPFINDTSNVGKMFGDYTIVTTSGTTGTPGIFIWDERTTSVVSALFLRMLTTWLNFRDVIKIIVGKARMAMIMAKDGHFASSIAAARLEKKLGKSFLGLSAHLPLSKLVSSLNSFSPMLMAPYASMASQFASEQEAGRLKIRPVLLTLSAEGLAQKEYSRIAKVFKAKVGNSYAASECPFLSYSCSHQWLHVNSDWVIIEPVDENYNIVPAGNLSHTVLITNLANKTQPILRYDIGDSVVLRPDACPCGNPFPAIQVKGRSADVLTFTTAEGEQVSIPPLAFTIQIDSIQGVERLQILQTEPDQVRVRLRFEKAGDKRAIVGKVQHAIEELFNERKLSHVSIVIGDESPEQSVGGKFREVIPLKAK